MLNESFCLHSIKIRIKTSRLFYRQGQRKFYRHSIRIRIKTFSSRGTQGLETLFHLHSSRIRIKTTSFRQDLHQNRSIFIPLEQGLRQIRHILDSDRIMFYLHSSRIRIKTFLSNSWTFKLSYSIAIPLQQGLTKMRNSKHNNSAFCLSIRIFSLYLRSQCAG